jgi:hypothetical protein
LCDAGHIDVGRAEWWFWTRARFRSERNSVLLTRGDRTPILSVVTATTTVGVCITRRSSTRCRPSARLRWWPIHTFAAWMPLVSCRAS